MISAYIDKIYIIFAKKTKNSIMVDKIKNILMMRMSGQRCTDCVNLNANKNSCVECNPRWGISESYATEIAEEVYGAIEDSKGNCEHHIGVWYDAGDSRIVTIGQLRLLAQEGSDFGDWTLADYLNYKRETNLIRFDHCPKCGCRIDWKKIREEVRDDG